jgi:hypothetical protein
VTVNLGTGDKCPRVAQSRVAAWNRTLPCGFFHFRAEKMMNTSRRLSGVVVLALLGCDTTPPTNPDNEPVAPKIEVKKTPDLNPKTDDDVDIDTPIPGDK